MRLSTIIWIVFLITLCIPALGQEKDTTSLSPFFKVEEREVVETKWKYTYAMHLESNTIIHQADEDYKFFLYLRYDYTYQQFLNGELSRGTWSLNGNELFYKFKHINKFVIADINPNKLVLEFTQPNSKGTYQYHFISVESKDAPFVKPANELPDINVNAADPKKGKKRWWSMRSKKKKKQVVEEKETYISVELIGGGYYGGIDPVIRDYIHIKSNGRLIKEYKSIQNGLMVTKKDIPRAQLEEFVEYCVKQKFFDLERIYDCETAVCLRRKHKKPTPVPLRLAIAYGNRKKVITISIWGQDENKARYVDYPPSLDNIIDAIQNMAHRLEDETYGMKK